MRSFFIAGEILHHNFFLHLVNNLCAIYTVLVRACYVGVTWKTLLFEFLLALPEILG